MVKTILPILVAVNNFGSGSSGRVLIDALSCICQKVSEDDYLFLGLLPHVLFMDASA